MTFDEQPFVDLTKASWNSLPTMRTVTLEKGRRYSITVTTEARILTGINLVWKRVSDDPAAELRAAAKASDALVAVVGLTSDLEAEEAPIAVPGFKGGDKTTLDLPADQQALLEEAKATGRPLIVVLMNGSPVNLAWAKANADAIVEAWYPGQAGGLAVGHVLSGKTNPAGPAADLLSFGRGSAAVRRLCDEGADLSLLHRQACVSVRLWAQLHQLRLCAAVGKTGANGSMTVTTEVRNTGRREGDEVAQLYLNFPKVEGTPRVSYAASGDCIWPRRAKESDLHAQPERPECGGCRWSAVGDERRLSRVGRIGAAGNRRAGAQRILPDRSGDPYRRLIGNFSSLPRGGKEIYLVASARPKNGSTCSWNRTPIRFTWSPS